MYRVALLIGLNSKNEVLLQHKTPDAPKNANMWVLFGGSIEEKEKPEEAIRREMREELKIDVDSRFFKTYFQEESWGTVERNVFFGTIYETNEVLRSNLQEGDDVDFFNQEKIRTIPINKSHLDIINDFLNSDSFHSLTVL